MKKKNGQYHMTAAEYQEYLKNGKNIEKVIDSSKEKQADKKTKTKKQQIEPNYETHLDDDTIIKFTIPLNPITKKNHQMIVNNPKVPGKKMIIPSSQYIKYEKEASTFLPLKTYVKEPCNIKYLFYMQTHRGCDLTNLEESIDDVLVKYQIIKDDNFKVIVSHDGSRVLYDKDNPRTEIEITKSKDFVDAKQYSKILNILNDCLDKEKDKEIYKQLKTAGIDFKKIERGEKND